MPVPPHWQRTLRSPPAPGVAPDEITALGPQVGIGREQRRHGPGLPGIQASARRPRLAASCTGGARTGRAACCTRPSEPLLVVMRTCRVGRVPAARASSASTVRMAASNSSTERYSTVLSPKLTRRSPVTRARRSASSCSCCSSSLVQPAALDQPPARVAGGGNREATAGVASLTFTACIGAARPAAARRRAAAPARASAAPRSGRARLRRQQPGNRCGYPSPRSSPASSATRGRQSRGDRGGDELLGAHLLTNSASIIGKCT